MPTRTRVATALLIVVCIGWIASSELATHQATGTSGRVVHAGGGDHVVRRWGLRAAALINPDNAGSKDFVVITERIPPDGSIPVHKHPHSEELLILTEGRRALRCHSVIARYPSHVRLANAVGMALVPHVALNKGVGAPSMWKGVRSAEATKSGVWAALMAREGMTGPPHPFEGRGSFWSLRGRGREFTLPDQAELCIERNWFKRFPADAQSQGVLVLLPDIRSWTSVEEIESIQYDMTFDNWQEVGSAPKWDPRNHETADHSMPFLLARGLLDGDVYLDSFTRDKILDPAVREVMAKMTLGPVADWRGLGTGRLTIRKKSGEQRHWDTLGGSRNPTLEDYRRNVNMTDVEIAKKFDRACAYMKVPDTQRDRARTMWGNLPAVKDIGDATQTLARFGNPQPLT